MKPESDPVTILNVDDDEAKRYIVTRILTRAGFSVKEAATGRQALQETINWRPDLVVLDVNLPDIHGFEVCRTLKADARTSSIPILHVSATAVDLEHRVQGLEGGADGYLSQDVEAAELIATVRALLRTKRAEERANLLSLQWQTTFDAIEQGIVVIDRDSRIDRCNATFASWLERKPAELQGLAANSLPLLSGLMSTTSPEVPASEWTWENKWFHGTLRPIPKTETEPGETVAVIADITQQKIFEERMRESQKLESLGLLAGGIAHDFNNLLVGILGSATLVLESVPEDYALRPVIETIATAGERASDLTRQLLAYAGKGNFFLEMVDLSEVVGETVTLAQAAMPKGICVHLDLAGDLPGIESDRAQIQQIVMNLILNAAESFPEKRGDVTVSTRATNPSLDPKCILPRQKSPEFCVVLQVRDNGIGMDQETQGRIFEPFFTTKFLGRGLGLAAVQGIVHARGGVIDVESTLGKGTLFTLYFPAHAAGKIVKPSKAAQTESAKKGTILVVDDEEVVRFTAKAILERRGHIVLTAADGQEGVKIFQENPKRISLVILDLTMPGMSGDEVFRALRQIDATVPVILSSGYNESEIMILFQGRDVNGFIQKPYLAARLIDQVNRGLAGRNVAINRAGE